MNAVLARIEKIEANVACSKCGALGHVGCDCGPKYLKPISAATAGVIADPQMSNRALAAKIGVGHVTIKRARDKLTVSSGTVETKRIGLDGKARKAPKPRVKPQPPLIHDECEDCNTNEERWQRSCASMLGEMLSLRPFWRKEFGKWENFHATTALRTLAKEAADELAKLANHINSQELQK